jgi:hypothetical protein
MTRPSASMVCTTECLTTVAGQAWATTVRLTTNQNQLLRIMPLNPLEQPLSAYQLP